jgi:NAD(P)-dependent dehydrogenase (short-subunit alcohol dehydrogenase family)
MRVLVIGGTGNTGQQIVKRLLEQGDTGEGQTARADVAEACVQALAAPSAQGKTFELYNVPGSPPSDWPALFSQLKSDQV